MRFAIKWWICFDCNEVQGWNEFEDTGFWPLEWNTHRQAIDLEDYTRTLYWHDNYQQSACESDKRYTFVIGSDRYTGFTCEKMQTLKIFWLKAQNRKKKIASYAYQMASDIEII